MKRAKLDVAGRGILLARAQQSTKIIGSSAPALHDALGHAVRWARQALHDGEMGPSPFLSLHEAMTQPIAAEESSSERHDREVGAIKAAATAPQQVALIRAFLEGGCRSLGEVERKMGWGRGHASVLAARIRRKLAAS